MKGNEKLLIEPGLQWTGEERLSPYFIFPSWFRRFAFQVLRPRHFVTYAYLCTLFDRNGICYPTREQIVKDLGLRNRMTVVDSLKSLQHHGFVVFEEKTLPNRQSKEKRMVYQRMAPEFTLLRLLLIGRIDESLYPSSLADPTSDESTSQKAVETGLSNLLGWDRWSKYANAQADAKGAVLRDVLRESLMVRLQRSGRTAAALGAALVRVDNAGEDGGTSDDALLAAL